MMGQLVVVLDDDDAVFDGVVKSLEEAGYLVLPLSTADGLVDELKATEAAALLLDLQTDTSTVGPDILTQLGHDEALGSLPVLVYSANARQLQELSPRLLARGYGVLQKPLDMGEVLRWLQERVG
jgi:CheY-like chemotaxis protein